MNLRDVWQATYTAGRVLPKPVGTCQYWHRSLDPKKVRSVVLWIIMNVSVTSPSAAVKGAQQQLSDRNGSHRHHALQLGRPHALAPGFGRQDPRRTVWCMYCFVGTSHARGRRLFHPCMQLIAVGFSRLQPRMTMARTLKLYKLPDAPQTAGLRQMRAEDAPQARLVCCYPHPFCALEV